MTLTTKGIPAEARPVQQPAPELDEDQVKELMRRSKRLMRWAYRAVWSYEHGMRMGRDDAMYTSAEILNVAKTLGMLPGEANAKQVEDFYVELEPALTARVQQPATEPDMDNLAERLVEDLFDTNPAAKLALVKMVRDSLDRHFIVGPDATEPPEFEELRERKDMRLSARLITENPCFTNSILAITTAYRDGWRGAMERRHGICDRCENPTRKGRELCEGCRGEAQ